MPLLLFDFFFRFSILFPVFLFICSSSFASPSPTPEYSAKNFQVMLKNLSDFIEEQMDDKDIPGISISLVEKKHTLWQQGFGYSDKENELAAKPQTIYAIGSLTTLITATAIMHLVENKKFKLEDKVTTLLPHLFRSTSNRQKEILYFDRSITVRDLLTHHSGLSIAKHKGMWSPSPEHFHASVQYALSHPPPYPAKMIFSHSNIGYSLLGFIIETFTKKNYQNFITENILPSMGLHNTGFYSDVKNKRLLSSHYKKGNKKSILHPRDAPSLGLYSTVEDLGKLAQLFLTKEASLINHNTINEMLSTQNDPIILDIGKQTGIGWTLAGSKINNAGLIMHRYGTSLFHRSRLILLPEHGIAAAVIANDATSFRAVEDISEQLVIQYLKLKKNIDAISVINPTAAPPRFPTLNFEQKYASRIGLISLNKIGQHIHADVMGWNFKLNKEPNGWFTIEYQILGILPFKLDWITDLKVSAVDVNGINYIISHYKGTQFLFGKALINKLQTNDHWQQHVGKYKLANPDELSELYEVENGEIKIVNDTLIFEYKLPFWLPLYFQLPIIPIGINDARIAGVGTGYNETISVSNINNTEQLNFSGYLIRKTTDD